MPWITEPCPDPVSLGLDIQTLPPLPAPAPDSRVLDDVPVMETGESLEDAENEFVVFRPYRRLGFEHCPERLLLRQGVLARLAAACYASNTPKTGCGRVRPVTGRWHSRPPTPSFPYTVQEIFSAGT